MPISKAAPLNGTMWASSPTIHKGAEISPPCVKEGGTQSVTGGSAIYQHLYNTLSVGKHHKRAIRESPLQFAISYVIKSDIVGQGLAPADMCTINYPLANLHKPSRCRGRRPRRPANIPTNKSRVAEYSYR